VLVTETSSLPEDTILFYFDITILSKFLWIRTDIISLDQEDATMEWNKLATVEVMEWAKHKYEVESHLSTNRSQGGIS
jgi:hypothetical protein